MSIVELDLAVGGQRLELLGDGAHRLREVGVDQRQLRLAVVGLDLLEHVVDLLERAQRRQPDVHDLRAQRLVGRGAQHLLGARDHDLQRRAQVVRELAEQPLAVVVDAREPLRQRRQLGVLARQALLDALAVGDRPALGDDERDLAVAAAQRAQQQVQRPVGAAGALDRDVDVEAGEAALGRGRRIACLQRSSATRRRRRATTAWSTAAGRSTSARSSPPAISAAGLTSSTWPSPSSSAMKLEDLACATCAISRRVTGPPAGASTSAMRRRSASTASSEVVQWSSRRPCELIVAV